jgi:hypothetical protein
MADGGSRDRAAAAHRISASCRSKHAGIPSFEEIEDRPRWTMERRIGEDAKRSTCRSCVSWR